MKRLPGFERIDRLRTVIRMSKVFGDRVERIRHRHSRLRVNHRAEAARSRNSFRISRRPGPAAELDDRRAMPRMRPHALITSKKWGGCIGGPNLRASVSSISHFDGPCASSRKRCLGRRHGQLENRKTTGKPMWSMLYSMVFRRVAAPALVPTPAEKRRGIPDPYRFRAAHQEKMTCKRHR